MIKLSIIFSICSLSVQLHAAGRTLTFEELPQLVSERNRKVRSSQAELHSSQVRTGYLRRSFLPHLELSGGSEAFQMGSSSVKSEPYWSLEGRLNLYRGGVDQLENQVRDTNVKTTELEVLRNKRHELSQARKLFWQILSYQNLIRLQEEAIETNDKSLKIAQRRVSTGVATRSDPLEFEMNQTILNQELKEFRHHQDVAKSQISVLLNFEEHESLEVVGEFPHPQEAEFQELTVQPAQLADVALSETKEKAFHLEAQKLSRWWAPSVDLYSRIGQLTSLEHEDRSADERREWVLGVRIKLDLFDGFEAKRAQESKRSQAHAMELQKQHHTHAVQAAFHELQHDLKLQHELLHGSETTINQAKEFLKLTLDEYGRGVKNGPDVLEASKKLLDFQRRDVELKKNYYTAQAELLAIFGE